MLQDIKIAFDNSILFVHISTKPAKAITEVILKVLA